MKGNQLAWYIVIQCLATANRSEGADVGQPWINEIHYDNAGTDSGEFVEIAVPSWLTDLSALRLTLYNGGDGSTYGSAHLLDSFIMGDTVESVTFYSKEIRGLQNGAPDGLALDLSGTVLDFVSYEGSFTAGSGPAAGLTAFDIGVVEGDATPVGAALGLAGAGERPGDFVWSTLSVATPGGPNLGQVFSVPEPLPTVLLPFLAAGLLVWHRPKPAGPSGRRGKGV